MREGLLAFYDFNEFSSALPYDFSSGLDYFQFGDFVKVRINLRMVIDVG
ncbi:Uncharacterised protein [uncultured archaeon]|nr:Uncharacterised protein [uncultured archaeon]